MLTMAWLVAGCQSGLTATEKDTDDGLAETIDEIAPVIEHESVDESQPFGEDVSISATVTDEGTGVLFVFLQYKNETEGDADWREKAMIPQGDLYVGTISGDDERSGGIDYYIEAFDRAQNTTTDPDDGSDDPYHFRLTEE